MTEPSMTPEEADTAIQATIANINAIFQASLTAAGIENPEQYQLALTEPPDELGEEDLRFTMLAAADAADTLATHMAAEPSDTTLQVANRVISLMLEPEPDRTLDMGWTFDTAAMYACAIVLMAKSDPHRKIAAWVDTYMTNEDGCWGFIEPTHGDPTPVIALLDAVWPEWKN